MAEHPIRTALVTGAAQGLGAAIARRLHADGLHVALADLNATAAAALAIELDPTGETARAIAVDVSDVESVRSCFADQTAAWGPPDVLVNNAGRTPRASVWEITPDEWDDVLGTNLRSYLLFCQLAGAAMREKGWGRIVNMSSFAGQQGGLVAGAHYAASKAGALVLTKIFARELAPHGVTVNAVSPAAIRTPAMGSDADAAEAGRSLPTGRVGTAEEVAAAVAYLVGPDSGFVTGATLDINGGVFMR
ncbi:SDR family NAD(P)-dependent oxidoreductase [Paenarthrobacter nitroguajacolicus]|uniref:SDR family oxidoreductase n=1 Tax=Paenarthrobacter nitroguajacolicus TaxID=211146 RepID=UPI0028660BB0|nr:SDR family NAD(P)-dependent oxidoreductase [Paenarthrobacter nitroguajacolicus]MDR6637013.1 3-oxoacyl-[acyl-carrier protein] reductase [Paenarthrobacter nitroguajacolicus]